MKEEHVDVIAKEMERRVREQLIELAEDEELPVEPEELEEGAALELEWVRRMGAEHWEAVAAGTGLHPWHLSQAYMEGMVRQAA